MIILVILALAVLANGYRLDNPPPSPTGMNMLRTMCEQNGANYTGVESAAVNFVHCVEVDFGVKMLETEIKDAYMYNSYDAFNKVFKKYCRKTPELKACYHKLMDAVAPCLEGEKEDFITVSDNVNDQILDYMCQSDGSIITAFIMEGGPQCFQEKTYEIMTCAESSKNSILYMEQKRTLSMAESYRMYDDLLNCIIRSVETCHSPTPSRIVKRVSRIIQQSIFQGKMDSNASASVSTEQVRHGSTATNYTTEPVWYKPTTTTEREWYNVNTTWQNEKGVSTDGSHNNIQVQFGHNGVHYNTEEDSKNDASKTSRKLFKASGNVVVAFDADIYI